MGNLCTHWLIILNCIFRFLLHLFAFTFYKLRNNNLIFFITISILFFFCFFTVITLGCRLHCFHNFVPILFLFMKYIFVAIFSINIILFIVYLSLVCLIMLLLIVCTKIINFRMVIFTLKCLGFLLNLNNIYWLFSIIERILKIYFLKIYAVNFFFLLLIAVT
jgi:hypothetical protein